MFWDASALIPLCVHQSWTPFVLELKDPTKIIWWGSTVECTSAVARLIRERVLTADEGTRVVRDLNQIISGAIEVQPTEQVRGRAMRLLHVHALRAADAFQLAAALIAYREQPADQRLVCFDPRLRAAAQREGFSIEPASLPVLSRPSSR